MYQEWIKKGLEKGISDLEILATRSQSVKLNVYQQKLEQHVQSDVESVTIRGIYNQKHSVIKFENLNDAAVEDLLDRLIENASGLTVTEPAIIYEGSKAYPEVTENTFDFNTVPVTKKIQFIKDLEQKVLDHPETKTVQTTIYQEVQQTTTLVNSKGLNLTRKANYAYAYSVGVFARGEDIVTGYDLKLAKNFNEFDVDALAEKTIERGINKLGGKSIPTQAYPVVFANDMFGDILQVFASIFSGEAAYRNLTSLKDKVGEKIGGENINLLNDPLHEKAYFQQPFDDEGVACQKRYVIQNGVFTGFNHNLKTAALFNQEPTGNGFGGGIQAVNLYLEPGTQTFDELIAPIQDGVYITDLVGLHAGVKQISGEFSLQAGGFKIKDGKLDHPVKMIVLSGNFFEVLNQVEAVGSDFEFGLNGIGSASVYVKSLMIAGE